MESGFLSEQERAVLRAVCDTLLPRLDPPPGTTDPAVAAMWRRRAADLDVAGAVEETLWLETTPKQQRQLRLALGLLEHPAALRLLTGQAESFRERNLLGREAVLRTWATSSLPPLRQAFLALKRLACFHFYAHVGPEGPNPNATLLGYPGPPLPPPAPPANPAHPIQPLPIEGDTELEADVCIIGSGAGGGVAAALLAAAGRRVVVLEDGGFHTEADFDSAEERGWDRLYQRRGAFTTADGGITILAGRTVGGGTTVNWTTCFRPPQGVLGEWARVTGIHDFLGPDLAASYAAVERRMHIHVPDRPLHPNNALLLAGAAALGWHHACQPRNVGACGDCGLCHFGCRTGGKQGTLRTYLQDAYDAGAQIVANCHADRLLLDGDRVIGVAARVHRPVEEHNPGAPTHRLMVRAGLVVVAAGAVNTPAVLLRSGVRHPQLGRNLYLHPSTGIIGEFAAPVEAWHGEMQAAYSDELADLSGDGYGVRLETVPLYPGFGAAASPWTGARAFRERMSRLPHLHVLLILSRDRVGGRVVLDSLGRAQVHYHPTAENRRFLVRGCQEGARLVLAAGALAAETLHNQPLRVIHADGLERFRAAVAAAGAAPGRLYLGSAHQMGTCRMGTDPAASVTDTHGAVRGVRGLYVCDTSLFPTASGVNPMLTVLGLAHWLMRGLAQS